ncbi:TetR/AcrR family transcriptional regulator [soil metagenome]
MSPRPAKPVRDEIRRDEIVAAARACVVRHGFHAASMQQIAQEARMSVGQIYRYFPNKEAIVHAIVERIVSQRIAWIASTGRQMDLPQVLASRMFDESPSEADDRVLLLEVTAEAARSPTVAAMVRAADRRLHAQALATVRLDHPALTEAEAAARVEFMAVLAEGTAFRRVTDQLADPEVLAALYREVIERLLPGAPGGASTSASVAATVGATVKRKPRR